MSGNRRDFLKETAAAVAAASGLGMRQSASSRKPTSQSLGEAPVIPPHLPMRVPGIHAYAEKSVAAGDTVQFRVSSTVPYELSVCRLGTQVDNLESDQVLHTFPKAEPRPQEIHPGSYIHVENGLPADRALKAITLECWVCPWRLDADQGLISSYDPSANCGFAVLMDHRGYLSIYLGDGGQFRSSWLQPGPKLEPRQWHHVAVTWDGKLATLYLNGKFDSGWAFEGPLKPGRTPLRLAAAGREGRADNFLDGELCMPVIYGRALSAKEVEQRFQELGLQQPEGGSVIACWPLSEEAGHEVADVSGHGHDGEIINRATWMIGGPSFDSGAIPRYGDYDPTTDVSRGHALRFASDDLFDCRWKVTHRYPLSKEIPSGIYVGRFRFEIDGKPLKYHVTFIVRKAPKRPKAPILVLCSTSTWLAYSATPFAANAPDRQLWSTTGLPNEVPEAPSYSCYRNHHQGQPSYQFGVNMPWPVAGPDVLFSRSSVGYSHLMRAERFAHSWLTEAGYDYDVVTDYDLHSDPAMLQDYKVLVINGHSEYWSVDAYEGVDKFLRQGGNVVAMSGNTMFWRVTYDDDGSVMECRKLVPRIGGRESATVGELYHSHDKKRGSLMRYCGHPAWKVLGLECIGWWGHRERESFGVYQLDQPDHFLFQQPEKVDLDQDETFGHAPGGWPSVGGHECDVRLPWIRQITKHFPEGASFPEEPPGITTLARVIKKGRRGIDYYAHWMPLGHGVVGEMIYWERPQGGRVFHGGCIATGAGLSADSRFQALMRNVLHHFGVEANQA